MLNFSVLLLLFQLLLCISLVQGVLFFPAASVLQMTASVSAPLQIPERKLFLDWGLQMNYDLPSNPAQFYNVPIWNDELRAIAKRAVQLDFHSNLTQTMQTHGEDKYDSGRAAGLHSSDFTAGELYHSFENLLVSYGFHETCLLRSVCELARHPFADEQRNILTEVLTFLLTPSLHDAFSSTEQLYRAVYEEAEKSGFLGENCSNLYSKCKLDLLSAITRILFKQLSETKYSF